MRLVVADDSALVRGLLVQRLNEVKGLQVVGEASDALEAIEVLASARPDAVILDFKMPGGNALSVLKYIRQEEMSVVVIVLTNYPYQQYRRACLSAGAHYFFDKSCEFEKVIRLLEQLISES